MSAITQTFGTADQVVFTSSIAIGGFIGIYFAYLAPKATNHEDDYLFGSRKMKTIPIAFSLAASFISGVALIALPAEVYVYGSQICYSNITNVMIAYVYAREILPVFHDLQGLSLNEYFEKRFDKRLRLLVSVLYFFGSICYLPIVMYVPALAYEQATGYNIHLVTPLVCIVCIFYTSIGGLKAVVWTDMIQMFFMLACSILLVVKGTYDIGWSAIWERTVATERLEPPYIDYDPTIRQTIFSVMIGGFFLKLKLGYLSQGQVQRHQSLSTISQAKVAVWIMMFLQTSMALLNEYMGLIIAAFYFTCDPIALKVVSAKDQIVPLFVMQTIGNFTGITGIFLSGVFSASLSTLSTILNTLSGVFVEDWIRGYTSWNLSGNQAMWMMRIFVVVLGIITVGLVFVAEKLGMIFQLLISVDAIFSGAILTIFVTALFLPWVSSLGALVGAATAVVSVMPLVIGVQYSLSQGKLHFPAKPVSFEGCTQMFNVSTDFVESIRPPLETTMPYGPTRGDVWYPFRISHWYFIPFSLACGITAAVFVTIFISKTDLRQLDRRLIAPISRRWLPKSATDLPVPEHLLVTNKEEIQLMLPIELQLYGQQ